VEVTNALAYYRIKAVKSFILLAPEVNSPINELITTVKWFTVQALATKNYYFAEINYCYCHKR
jgi:hypothetical protein